MKALWAAIIVSVILTANAAAQEISCLADKAIETAGIVTLNDQQMSSWATATLTTGTSLAEELQAYGVAMNEFTTGTEIPLTLPGHVASSIYVLERQSSRNPVENTWVILYSMAPTEVRLELERQGISYPWSGFVLIMDGNDAAAPLRLGMLGQPEHQLVYDRATRTFQRASRPILEGVPEAKISQGCIDCLLDLVKSVACEAVADGVACATVAGCPGAIISALIRASWKLLTQDLCFQGDIASCAFSCALPQITITPSSNAQVSSGLQKITVSISGTNAGAWALAVPQNSLPGAPLIKLGGNPRILDWNPRAGVYTIYAGNVPLLNTPGVARSTNVKVGQQGSTAIVNWTITDECNDSRGLRIRFFDRTIGGVFPGLANYYAVPSAGQKTFSFNAPRGSRVCLGAAQDPPGSSSWCYGINGNLDGSYSNTCCTVIPATGTHTLSNRLVCD
jgi:hypothetical protein